MKHGTSHGSRFVGFVRVLQERGVVSRNRKTLEHPDRTKTNPSSSILFLPAHGKYCPIAALLSLTHSSCERVQWLRPAFCRQLLASRGCRWTTTRPPSSRRPFPRRRGRRRPVLPVRSLSLVLHLALHLALPLALQSAVSRMTQRKAVPARSHLAMSRPPSTSARRLRSPVLLRSGPTSLPRSPRRLGQASSGLCRPAPAGGHRHGRSRSSSVRHPPRHPPERLVRPRTGPLPHQHLRRRRRHRVRLSQRRPVLRHLAGISRLPLPPPAPPSSQHPSSSRQRQWPSCRQVHPA